MPLTRHAGSAFALLVATLSAVSFASAAAQPAAPTGSLLGTVFIDTGDARIADAEIVFPKLNISARSDRAGNFQITGIPAGPQELVVRRVGYESYSATMTFRVAQKVEADFMLKPIVTKLARVNVRAGVNPRYAIRLQDFEERRRFGTGRFLTDSVFEHAVGQNMSQVLVSRIPGVRTEGKGTEQVLVGRHKCALQVIVNGMTLFNGRQQNFDLNSLYTNEVIGVEYYTVANTPSQFGGTGPGPREPTMAHIPGGPQCGTLVIWTK